MASDGRRKVMPCGHIGVALIGQFFQCESQPSCDQKAKCPKCGSHRTALFQAASLPEGSLHCWTCGACWWNP